MGPVKRKDGPTNDSFVRSKKVGENDNRPLKRLRQEDSDTTKRDGAGTGPVSAPIHVPKLARTKDEETAFPRGGASILTPLEHKQIHIDATRDVLFEQTASRAKEEDGEAATAPGGKKRKPKSKGKKGEEVKGDEDDQIRIEGLSYKVRDLLSNGKWFMLM